MFFFLGRTRFNHDAVFCKRYLPTLLLNLPSTKKRRFGGILPSKFSLFRLSLSLCCFLVNKLLVREFYFYFPSLPPPTALLSFLLDCRAVLCGHVFEHERDPEERGKVKSFNTYVRGLVD